jgi:hypothetical protein
MKPLVNTSVFGLVPLPQLPERHGDERRTGTDALSAELREMASEDLCYPCAEARLANVKYNAERLGLYAQLVFAIWRRRGEDR